MSPWTVARQAPLSMEFSRLEYWSGSPFPSPGDLPNPGIEPRSPALQADSLPTVAREALKKHETKQIFKISVHKPSFIAGRNIKWFSFCGSNQEVFIKITMKCHYIPPRMAKIKKTDNTESRQGCETIIRGRHVSCYSHLENWPFPLRFNTVILCNPEVSFLGIYSLELYFI